MTAAQLWQLALYGGFLLGRPGFVLEPTPLPVTVAR